MRIPTQFKVPFNQGREARQTGHERVSPYRGVKAEDYWLAGYDSTKAVPTAGAKPNPHNPNDYRE